MNDKENFRLGSLCLLVALLAVSVAPGDLEDTTCRNDATAAGWYPKDEHPCTIDCMTFEEMTAKYGLDGGLPPLFAKPLVIRAGSDAAKLRNHRIRELTVKNKILQKFPVNFTVTLSSSNSYSEYRRNIPFSQYLEEVATQSTSPDQRSNESWYLFGETYSKEWKNLLLHYKLPPCQACQPDQQDLIALSFGIGNSGSGVSWHVHGPGFSEALHGRKHWILQKKKPNFHPNQTSYNWMYHNYSIMMPEERPLECTLYPGDLVYFPDMWWHATLNLDDYTAFVSTFTQEHLFASN
jgi:hypothetical protein